LLLTTGNKSEHATGYATLYGDQNGGLAPIADLLKTEVFALARHLNTHHERLGFRTPPIPENTISKPPSAELRHDQTDQDTLPPYDTLDAILSAYIDERMSPEAIAERLGHEPAFVDELVRRIDRNEHKRFQLCVAIKLRARAFGPGRRHPIVQRPPQSNDRR
jgi:NAD+ synthase (glutamine-hydrolysing)